MTAAAPAATTPGRIPAAAPRADGGGLAARRAVTRWAWRLFRREWRQQLLVLALIVVAVAATIVASAVATTTPAPAASGFGTAQDIATFGGSDAHLGTQIAALQHRFGRVDVIENKVLPIPGSIGTYDLRAQDPRGAFGRPMLALAEGRYPTGAHDVALTAGLASALGLRLGGAFRAGPGGARRVVGIVENPQSLLDEFALVAPGQVSAPTEVTVLFDARGVAARSIGPNVQSRSSASQANALNPETISLAALTLGMILIALVAVGGFTVLAQRRLRSLGMLSSLGATDRNVGFVVRANGLVVGVVGALIGAAIGILAWLAYRPHLEASAHHLIGMFALPWLVVALAMVLAVVATYFAASRPARSIARIPVVAALSGRPAPPRQVHRSALPGIAFLVIAFLLLGYSGSTGGGNGSGGGPELVLGLVALIPGIILLSPFCLSALARLSRRSPLAVRLALRDLARYRARSGSALASISLGVLIAMVVALVAAARYGNVLDYAGPNLAGNQLAVYTPNGPYGPGGPGNGPGNAVTARSLAAMQRSVGTIAASLGARGTIALETTSATLNHAAPGRNFSGPIYVATPQLLHAFGINASQLDPEADILTMRPGLSGTSKMQLVYGSYFAQGLQPSRQSPDSFPCPPRSCLANPVIEEVGALPAGTSAPNTVITEHAVRALGLHPIAAGWLVQSPQPLTASQINNARESAAAAGMTIETRNGQPDSAEIINWATAFGIALALAILAMSIGLIRSETAGDLRTLAATGASSRTRRALTAATAGALGLAGAVLGTGAAYVGVLGWIRDNSLNGGISALGNVPVANLLVIVVAMPLVAAVVGFLLAGRQPPTISHQPLD